MLELEIAPRAAQETPKRPQERQEAGKRRQGQRREAPRERQEAPRRAQERFLEPGGVDCGPPGDAKTIKNHWDGILNWFDSRLTAGLVEGFNSLLQAAKARARGYRTTTNLIVMAYLIAGKLDFALPT